MQITQVWTKLSSKLTKKRPTATRYRVLPSVPALPSSAMEVSSKLSLKIHQQKYWSETWTRGSAKSKLFATQGEAECSAAYTGSSLMTCTSGSSLLTPYGWVWRTFPLLPLLLKTFSTHYILALLVSQWFVTASFYVDPLPPTPPLPLVSYIIPKQGWEWSWRFTALARATTTPGPAVGPPATPSHRNSPPISSTRMGMMVIIVIMIILLVMTLPAMIVHKRWSFTATSAKLPSRFFQT